MIGTGIWLSFSDFFFQYVMNQFRFIAYIFEINIVLSFIRILVYANNNNNDGFL